MAIETPDYIIIEKDGHIEHRKYYGYITANIKVKADSYKSAGNKAFSFLADYIFGNNTKNSKIAMTAPVISQKPAILEKINMSAPVTTAKLDYRSYIISFTMPAIYTLNDLPKPNNDNVFIKAMPPHEVVAIGFSGYTSEGDIEDKSDELREWANKKQIKISSQLTVLRYDPPWKPGFLRKNEVCFKVV
ncbi:MAG: heme-binding protein [Candidatus Saccharibacteria bacterium]